ncbi:MAG TPA: hypothetical protein VLG67_01325 [Candidatus Saccharimonadales bacterium]|nr:hypothetical protein [Candidatus Saccharimonadales bacterium]
MNVIASKKFKKAYDKLPQHIQKKTKKSIEQLRSDLFYPGLNTKKMEGENLWEARIDRSYRFTFEKHRDEIILHTVGPHDRGLGKR